MLKALEIGLIGLLTGVIGTVGGGLLILPFRKIGEKLLGVILGISAGIMTVIVFIDLIPEAMEVGSLAKTLFGLVAGVIIIMLLDLNFPHKHFSITENLHGRYIKVGFLLAIGIALHNLPEGLAIGAGYTASEKLGLGLAVIIAIHNMPEGLAVATTLSLGKLKPLYVLGLTALAGIPMGLGAFIGAYFGQLSSTTLAVSLGLAAGSMLYITFDELVPDAHNLTNNHSAITGIIGGIILGLLISGII